MRTLVTALVVLAVASAAARANNPAAQLQAQAPLRAAFQVGRPPVTLVSSLGPPGPAAHHGQVLNRSRVSMELNPVLGNRVQTVGLSLAEDVALGHRLAVPLAEALGGIHNDPVINKYLAEVALRLIRANGFVASGLGFSFYLAKSAEANVYSLPGGHVFLTVGALRAIRSEAGLAMILGHGMVRSVARHAAERLGLHDVYRTALEPLQSGLANVPDAPAAFAQATKGFNEGLLARIWEQELEADQLALRAAMAAEYSSDGAADFLRLTTRLELWTPLQARDTHPDATTRAKSLGQLARSLPKGGDSDAEAYTKHVLTPLGGAAP